MTNKIMIKYEIEFSNKKISNLNNRIIGAYAICSKLTMGQANWVILNNFVKELEDERKLLEEQVKQLEQQLESIDNESKSK